LDARANSRIKLLWIGIGGDDPSVVTLLGGQARGRFVVDLSGA
jgi:hypothetical protein